MIAILIILSMSLYAWLGTAWFSHDILEAKLPAGCGVLFFSEDSQVVFTIAMGCQGQECRINTNEYHPDSCGLSYGISSAICNNTSDRANLMD